MCFSTTASVGAGVALGMLGVISMKKAKEPSEYALAAMPLIFSIQQFTEGAVWMSLTHSGWEGSRSMATIGFLIIAQAIWPMMLPISILRFEKDPVRKKLIRLFLVSGVIVAGYFLYCMFAYHAYASIVNDHIYYHIEDYPKKLIPIAAAFYLAATIGPPLASRNKKVQAMGVIILISYVITRVYFQPALVSVWCFFGTLIGILVYVVILENQKERSNLKMSVADKSEFRDNRKRFS